jgi:K+ transporter
MMINKTKEWQVLRSKNPHWILSFLINGETESPNVLIAAILNGESLTANHGLMEFLSKQEQ